MIFPYCPIDETWFASFGEFVELSDGKICKSCGHKVGLDYGPTSSKYGMLYSVDDVKSMIDDNRKINLDDLDNLSGAEVSKKRSITIEVNIPEHVILTANSSSVTINRKGVRSFANRALNGEQLIPMV